MDLPIELIHKIFNYFNLHDLFNCKLVCKSWYSIILKFKLKSLVVKRYFYIHEQKLSWYHSEVNIDSKYDLIDPKLFFCLLNNPILNQLKYLKIDATFFNNEFNINELNKFICLKHLEIEYLVGEQNFNLSLNELEILNLNFFNTESQISIDAPKLKAIQFDFDYVGFSGFSFKHPKSITDLETNHLGKYLKQFENVTCLKSDTIRVLDETTIVHLIKLQEIHFERIIHDFSSFNNSNGEPDFSYIINEDINSKTKALWKKKPNLKIYFFGILLSNGSEIDKDWINKKELVYAKNYDRLKYNLEFVHNMDYYKLMKNFNNEIPSDFFLKFNNIKNCTLINLDQSYKFNSNEEHICWFLSNLDNLNSLTLKYTKLSQTFMNKLYTIGLSYRLTIEESPDFIINYDFLLNLNQLTSFITNQEINKKLLELLFSNLDDKKYFFESISFKFRNQIYWIKRNYENSNYKYTLFTDKSLIEDKANLNSVIEYFRMIN